MYVFSNVSINMIEMRHFIDFACVRRTGNIHNKVYVLLLLTIQVFDSHSCSESMTFHNTKRIKCTVLPTSCNLNI
jgi:hypothetical protein